MTPINRRNFSEFKKLDKRSKKNIKRLGFNGGTYTARNAILKELGFANYAEYVRSDLWKRVRAKAFGFHGSYCMTCPERAIMCHHNRYAKADLLGDCVDFIVPICKECHDSIELDAKGNKNGLYQAFKAWRRLRRIWVELKAKIEYNPHSNGEPK